MRQRIVFVLFVCAVFPIQIHAQPALKLPRIDPAGIPGTLVLVGRGEVSDAILDRFAASAGGKKGRAVILQFDAGREPAIPEDVHRLLAAAKRAELEISIVRFDAAVETDADKRLAALADATGVWLTGTDLQIMRERCSAGSLAKAITSLLSRGGVIGTASGTELVGRTTRVGDVQHGLGWLPDFHVATPQPDVFPPTQPLQRAAALVGCEIYPGAALLVRGRDLEALGNGEVFVRLAATSNRSAEKIPLKGRKQTDLTLLRRSARDRAHDFPNGNVGSPVVEKGTLVIVGGGKSPAGLTKQFVDLAGGDKASIVLLPTAVPDPIPNQEPLAETFRRHGAKVTVLPGRTLKDVESPEYLDALRKATGIWFGGGRQWRFVDAYEETKAYPLMLEVLGRGGVIGGTSAGASIQAEYLARGSPYGNLEIMATGYERGLGFLKGVAIDQHFTQRRRHAEMSALMKALPQYLGIGIDEATALIVRGPVGEVVGQGSVYFYDTRRPIADGAKDYEVVPAGGRYDMRERKIVPKS